MEPVVKPKTKGPSKPVKSFMETLEMSKSGFHRFDSSHELFRLTIILSRAS